MLSRHQLQQQSLRARDAPRSTLTKREGSTSSRLKLESRMRQQFPGSSDENSLESTFPRRCYYCGCGGCSTNCSNSSSPSRGGGDSGSSCSIGERHYGGSSSSSVYTGQRNCLLDHGHSFSGCNHRVTGNSFYGPSGDGAVDGPGATNQSHRKRRDSQGRKPFGRGHSRRCNVQPPTCMPTAGAAPDNFEPSGDLLSLLRGPAVPQHTATASRQLRRQPRRQPQQLPRFVGRSRLPPPTRRDAPPNRRGTRRGGRNGVPYDENCLANDSGLGNPGMHGTHDAKHSPPGFPEPFIIQDFCCHHPQVHGMTKWGPTTGCRRVPCWNNSNQWLQQQQFPEYEKHPAMLQQLEIPRGCRMPPQNAAWSYEENRSPAQQQQQLWFSQDARSNPPGLPQYVTEHQKSDRAVAGTTTWASSIFRAIGLNPAVVPNFRAALQLFIQKRWQVTSDQPSPIKWNVVQVSGGKGASGPPVFIASLLLALTVANSRVLNQAALAAADAVANTDTKDISVSTGTTTGTITANLDVNLLSETRGPQLSCPEYDTCVVKQEGSPTTGVGGDQYGRREVALRGTTGSGAAFSHPQGLSGCQANPIRTTFDGLELRFSGSPQSSKDEARESAAKAALEYFAKNSGTDYYYEDDNVTSQASDWLLQSLLGVFTKDFDARGAKTALNTFLQRSLHPSLVCPMYRFEFETVDVGGRYYRSFIPFDLKPHFEPGYVLSLDSRAGQALDSDASSVFTLPFGGSNPAIGRDDDADCGVWMWSTAEESWLSNQPSTATPPVTHLSYQGLHSSTARRPGSRFPRLPTSTTAVPRRTASCRHAGSRGRRCTGKCSRRVSSRNNRLSSNSGSDDGHGGVGWGYSTGREEEDHPSCWDTNFSTQLTFHTRATRARPRYRCSIFIHPSLVALPSRLNRCMPLQQQSLGTFGASSYVNSPYKDEEAFSKPLVSATTPSRRFSALLLSENKGICIQGPWTCSRSGAEISAISAIREFFVRRILSVANRQIVVAPRAIHHLTSPPELPVDEHRRFSATHSVAFQSGSVLQHGEQQATARPVRPFDFESDLKVSPTSSASCEAI